MARPAPTRGQRESTGRRSATTRPENSQAFDVDLHTHTRFTHGTPGSPTLYDPVGARLLATFARWRDLEGVALTNHDYYRPFETADVVIRIPGIEVSTTHGHVLIIGPDPPEETIPGELTPRQAVECARARGCAAILAHPFRNSTLLETDVPFDAIEINGKHPARRTMVEDVAETRRLPLVGGSDAHFPFEVGRAYTTIHADSLSPSAVVEAIREGRVEANVSSRSTNRLLQAVYERIHAFKGHI